MAYTDLEDPISDESSFYGDEKTKARLKSECAAFYPAQYRANHEKTFQTIAARAQKRQAGSVVSHSTKSRKSGDLSQLEEKVKAFDYRQTELKS